MKKLWINALLSALFISISIFVYAERREKEVNPEKLPQNVQQFISSHFSNESITGAKVVKYGYHKVMLTNGYEALFDRQGKWIELDSENKQPLPSSLMTLLPQQAQKYMAQKHPDCKVCSIERNSHGYEVETLDAQPLKIHFDPKGAFINELID